MDSRLAIPHAEPGNRIGLFGGSFNPPHSGHRLVADIALARLGLDRLWWLVTPGNPLKDHSELAPLARRLDAVEAIARHPRMVVTALETQLGTAYSARTLARLTQLRPRLNFVWVMGADNLAGFHRWQDWRDIFARVPIAVVDRPGATLPALASPAAQSFAGYRLDEADARLLPGMAPPAWTFLTGPRDASSSTRIRALARDR